MKPRLVLVTGSGRSGTSSVAGTLKRLGLHVPQPEVPADEKNPRGYYEPLWVTEFHKRVLNPVPVRTIDTRPDAAAIADGAITAEVEAELRAGWPTSSTRRRCSSRTRARSGSCPPGPGSPPSSAPRCAR